MHDLVITYVNPLDPVWKDTFAAACRFHGRRTTSQPERYRDWDTLRYLLRGAARFMPWIRKVHLVVQTPSQVPTWINTAAVNIVTHDQIIPPQHLPTYNSAVIELFLHQIPGLSPRFIYANDDMIPVSSLTPDDFFAPDGNPKLRPHRVPYTDSMNIYRHHLRNGEQLVRHILRIEEPFRHVTKTGHNIAPMLTSTWRLLWESAPEALTRSCTTFRQPCNINQDIAAFWHITTGNVHPSYRRTRYVETPEAGLLARYLQQQPPLQLICVNDSGTPVTLFQQLKDTLHTALASRLPDKSVYEK